MLSTQVQPMWDVSVELCHEVQEQCTDPGVTALSWGVLLLKLLAFLHPHPPKHAYLSNGTVCWCCHLWLSQHNYTTKLCLLDLWLTICIYVPEAAADLQTDCHWAQLLEVVDVFRSHLRQNLKVMVFQQCSVSVCVLRLLMVYKKDANKSIRNLF